MLVNEPSQRSWMTLTSPVGAVRIDLSFPGTEPVRLARSSSVADAVGENTSGPNAGVLILPLQLVRGLQENILVVTRRGRRRYY